MQNNKSNLRWLLSAVKDLSCYSEYSKRALHSLTQRYLQAASRRWLDYFLSLMPSCNWPKLKQNGFLLPPFVVKNGCNQ